MLHHVFSLSRCSRRGSQGCHPAPLTRAPARCPPQPPRKGWVLPNTTPDVNSLYKLGKELGKGQFGTTFLATDKRTGDEVAVKSISKRKMATPEDMEDVRREVQIMHHLAGERAAAPLGP